MLFAKSLLKLALASLTSAVLANPFMTTPTDSTTCTAGQSCQIIWGDDGVAPSLTTFGNATIGLWVGSSSSQTMVQLIINSVNVSTANTITWTPLATAGSSGNFYFIRFDSLNAKDPKNAANPAQSFSSKFTLTGMTGTFNASVQAQIDGKVTTTTTSTPTSTLAKASPTPTVTTVTSSPASNATPAANAAATKPASNGAEQFAARLSAPVTFAVALGAVYFGGSML